MREVSMSEKKYKINFYYKDHGKQVLSTKEFSGASFQEVVENLLNDYENLVIVKDSTRYLNKNVMSKEDFTYLDLCEHAT